MTKAIGRPPKFDRPDDLRDKIDSYLQDPPKIKHFTKDGQEFEVPSITITGLCWHLGFASRQSFYDYESREFNPDDGYREGESKDSFSYIIKRARLFIENDYEVLLKNGQCTGAIFALKCMGWFENPTTGDDDAAPLNITFEVKDAVKDITVTKGKAKNDS